MKQVFLPQPTPSGITKEGTVPNTNGKKITDLIDPKNPPCCATCGFPIDMTARTAIVIHWNGLFVDKYYHPVCAELDEVTDKN